MDRDTELRIARNEALLRDVNEAIERGRWPGDEKRPMRFRCECASLDCNEAMELTRTAYENVRQHPRRFVVSPGHEVPEAEAVIETHPAYLVIEKLDEAGALAAELDPRS